MIFAAVPWLSISINLLLVIFVLVCLAMSLVILMQRPKNEGLGAAFGSGTTDQLFGARTTNVLQKATVWFATLFFVMTLALAILINQRNRGVATLVAPVKETPAETSTTTPPVPSGEETAPIPGAGAEEGKPLESEGVPTLPSGLPGNDSTPAPAPTPEPGQVTPPVEIPQEPQPGDPPAPPAEPEKAPEQAPQ